LYIKLDFVNSVNYKVYMNYKNNNKSWVNKFRITQKGDYDQHKQSGIYLRDDHCDWGSSGMNEYTNEYPLHIISDDK